MRAEAAVARCAVSTHNISPDGHGAVTSLDLANKVVLVTGASSGIGRELVAVLLRESATVIATGRDIARLGDVARDHPLVVTVVANLDSVDGRVQLADDVERLGGVDIVINNAGTQTEVDARHPPSWDVFEREIATNLAAPIHLVHLLLPTLVARGTRASPSAIVNITSGLALAPKAASAPYCATKAGLRSYSKALRWQLRNEPVRVVEALPPLVKTPMTAGRNDAGMAAAACAQEIVDGLRRGRSEIYVGKSKLLKVLGRVAPGLAEKKMRDM
jgi:uncharacterized oxidoreductase